MVPCSTQEHITLMDELKTARKVNVGTFCALPLCRWFVNENCSWQAFCLTGCSLLRGHRGFSPPHRNPSWAHTLASGVTDGIQPPPEEGCSSADGLTARRESTHAPIPIHTHTHARTACITPEHTAFTKHTCTLFCQHVFPAYTRRDTHTHPHPYPHTHTGWVYPFINKDESQFPLLSC